MKDNITLSWEKFTKTGSIDAYLEYHSQVVDMMKNSRGQLDERYINDRDSNQTADIVGKG